MVILEIDKEMLSAIFVPLPGIIFENEIGDLILKANHLRDQAWKMEHEANAHSVAVVALPGLKQ